MSDLDPPRAASMATDEAACQPPVRTGCFLDGLSLARFAAGMLARRPALTLAVAILAGISFFSITYFGEHLAWQWPPNKPSPLGNPAAAWQPVWTFTAPLAAAATSVAPLAWSPLTWLGGVNDANVASYVIISAAMLPPAFAAALLVLVGLLGWTRDADKALRISAWPTYWRQHLASILVINLLLIACSIAITLIAFPILGVLIIAGDLDLEGQRILNILFNGVPVIPALLLMLAPFALVARGLGVKRGISEGGRLLRNNSPALLVIFILFAFFYACLLLGAASPWPLSGDSARSGSGAPLWWRWLRYEMLAILGLWLAHAFMEIAKRPEALPLTLRKAGPLSR